MSLLSGWNLGASTQPPDERIAALVDSAYCRQSGRSIAGGMETEP